MTPDCCSRLGQSLRPGPGIWAFQSLPDSSDDQAPLGAPLSQALLTLSNFISIRVVVLPFIKSERKHSITIQKKEERRQFRRALSSYLSQRLQLESADVNYSHYTYT